MEDSPSAQGTCGRVRKHRRDPDVLDMARLIPKPGLWGAGGGLAAEGSSGQRAGRPGAVRGRASELAV